MGKPLKTMTCTVSKLYSIVNKYCTCFLVKRDLNSAHKRIVGVFYAGFSVIFLQWIICCHCHQGMRNKEVFATDMAKDLTSSWFAFCSVCKERLLLKCTGMGAAGGGGDVVIVPVPANFNYKVKMRLKLTGDSDPIMDIQIRIQTKSVLTIIDRDDFCIPLFIPRGFRLITVLPTALALLILRNLVLQTSDKCRENFRNKLHQLTDKPTCVEDIWGRRF